MSRERSNSVVSEGNGTVNEGADQPLNVKQVTAKKVEEKPSVIEEQEHEESVPNEEQKIEEQPPLQPSYARPEPHLAAEKPPSETPIARKVTPETRKADETK